MVDEQILPTECPANARFDFVAYCLSKIIWKKWVIPLFNTLPNQKWASHQVVPTIPLRNSNFAMGSWFLGHLPQVSLQQWRSELLLAGEGVNHICYKRTFCFVTSEDSIPFEIILTTPMMQTRNPKYAS